MSDNFFLSNKDRQKLETLVKLNSPNIKEVMRAQAILWHSEGESVDEISDQLGVNRVTVYRWINRFQNRNSDTWFFDRLKDAPRKGRPPTAKGIIDPIIDAIIDKDPSLYGYRYSTWTAALLKQYLAENHNIRVSRKSIGLAISRLHLCWKRPRYQLALQPDALGQIKRG